MKLILNVSRNVSGIHALKKLEPAMRMIASKVNDGDQVIGLNLVGRKKITELNRLYKGRRGSAEILTFDFGDDDETFGEDNIRAEIYIYYGKARNTAKKLGVSYKDYLLRLFVHGICHILGYKHGTDQEAQEMEEVEKKLLRPYLKKRTLSQMFE